MSPLSLLSDSPVSVLRLWRWGTALATATFASGLLMTPAVDAQSAAPQPIFENVKLGRRFSPDPLIIRGISGGSVSTPDVSGRRETPTGSCIGYIDEQPDHILELTSFFNYLSLQVESPEDTTLLVKGPGGSWCNDDAEGKNPGISGQWLAGEYKVWVGSFQENKYHPYVIRISEVQLLNPGPSRR
ncbi:hypothetical protein [Coleofasciculus sp.]|uniref:hypothetical protein n=1 Tax=Coleofasciculus sp. TaxID=3100458 RepID=UPI003A246BCE